MKWLSTFTIHRLLCYFFDSLIALLFDIQFHLSISISLFLTLSHAFLLSLIPKSRLFPLHVLGQTLWVWNKILNSMKNRNELQHQLLKTLITAIIPTRCDKLVYWSSEKFFHSQQTICECTRYTIIIVHRHEYLRLRNRENNFILLTQIITTQCWRHQLHQYYSQQKSAHRIHFHYLHLTCVEWR